MLFGTFGLVFSSPKFVEGWKTFLQKSLRNIAHGDKIKGPRFRKLLKISQKVSKIAIFFGLWFWKRFWSLLGGVWEAKIGDFRTLFMFFSMPKSTRNFGGQKNGKNRKKERIPAQKHGMCGAVGERIYRIGGAQHASNFKFGLRGILFIFFLNSCYVHVGNVKEMTLYSARRALPVGEAAETPSRIPPG